MKLEQGRARNGFTLIEFLIVVAVLVLLAAMLLPALPRRSKTLRARINCTINLKQIGMAYRQWSIDQNGKLPMEVSITNGGAMEAVAAGNVAAVFQVMSNELNTPKILFCPAEKRRVSATTFTHGFANTNLSYFVGLDINTNSSPQMFLSGDDNLIVGGMVAKPGTLSLWTNTPVAWSDDRHKKQGNIGLADGSVQQFSTSKLMEGLRNTGLATNRFALP